MSLILTTNTSVNNSGNSPTNTGLNRPYDYTNFLTNTFEIEANSEVAVQSVKVNKEGNISVNRNNNQFYVYLGDKDRQTAMEDTTTTPIHTFLNIAGGKQEEVNVETMPPLIKEAIDRGMGHPDMVLNNGTNTTGSIVTVDRNADKTFQGYNLDIKYGMSASKVSSSNTMTFEDCLTAPDHAGTWNQGTKRMTKAPATATSTSICEMINTSMPLSQVGGVFQVDFKEAGAFWSVGLTRYLDQTQLIYSDQNVYSAPAGTSYFDWVAKSVFDPRPALAGGQKYFLRLFHSVIDSSRGNVEGGTPTDFYTLKEFDYTTGGGSSSSLVELFDVSGSYTELKPQKIRFTMNNEQMRVDVIDNKGAGTVLNLVLGTNASKLKNLKPGSATTRYIYPKMRVRDDNKYLTIEEFQGSKPTGFIYGNNRDTGAFMDGTFVNGLSDWDWWCKLYFRGQCGEYGKTVDMRQMFDYDGDNKDENYVQIGLNASGAIKNSASNIGCALILTDSNKEDDEFGYYPTPGANATELLGFENNPLLDVPNASTTTSETYKSSNIPQMVSTNSIFVRLNNFLQRTINGQTNGVSKILYHLPRFDNSGTEFGGLFYEPHERVYVKLHNTENMRINDFSVSLVNPDETLSDNLTGKTIVMFHIRKSNS